MVQRVVIFGGRGYIGHHLTGAISQTGKYTVYSFDRKPGPPAPIQKDSIKISLGKIAGEKIKSISL
jgi:nucleoside-diphosphate-sugar epimerase